MEQDFGSFVSTPYSNKQTQYHRPRNNYYSTNERLKRNRYSTVDPNVLHGLIILTIFFAIITLIAYFGVIYTVIISLGFTIIMLYFFPEKLSMIFPNDTNAPDAIRTKQARRSSFTTRQGYDRLPRDFDGIAPMSGLYSQDFCNVKPIQSTYSEQTPLDLTFDSSLIGNDNSTENTRTQLIQSKFPDIKYKAAPMSYGDLNSDSYIRMSKKFLKETPLYEYMDSLTSNLKPWLSVHVISKAAKVIDDYKNRNETTESLRDFRNAPQGVSQRYYEERIKNLSSGLYLAMYNGNTSNSLDQPSDAYIIMYLLSVYFTIKTHISFSDNYVITPYQAQNAMREPNSRIYICLTRKSPTHYDIIAQGKVHTVLPGTNNVFHAIILFFYYILNKNNGYLVEGINIKDMINDMKMTEILLKKP